MYWPEESHMWVEDSTYYGLGEDPDEGLSGAGGFSCDMEPSVEVRCSLFGGGC